MTVMWLNAPGTMGRGWRKGQGPEMQCFGKKLSKSESLYYIYMFLVFNSNVMLLCIEQTVKRRPSKVL